MQVAVNRPVLPSVEELQNGGWENWGRRKSGGAATIIDGIGSRPAVWTVAPDVSRVL
jgi:hypothetical protein